MRDFAELFRRLDETTKTTVKVAAMADYFQSAPREDSAWAMAFLSGNRLKSVVKRAVVRGLALEQSGLPEWLYDECRQAVGDSGETMAKILPPATQELGDAGLAEWVEARVLRLAELEEDEQRGLLADSWDRLDGEQRFVYNKLITGGFRVGVSRELVVRAVAQALGMDRAVIARRIMGDWKATPEFWASLSDPDDGAVALSQPYPFCLAHQLEDREALGDPKEWLIEWKWDGIRAQLIRREGQTFLWSRGEDLIADAFPDVAAIGDALPDGTVLDGEIAAWQDGKPLPFGELQRRIGRKKPGKKMLSDVPCVLVAFDVLEHDGTDLREESTESRRAVLDQVVSEAGHASLLKSELVEPSSWEEAAALREMSRERRTEGLMLKRRDAPYGRGRKKGLWWKWKVDPLSVDAVLIYAQRGSGRRASLYTDYTFGVWDGEELVPFAKAYSGLTDEEIRKVDSFIRRNTKERFGPVRTVEPELVMEIAFEGIRTSTRHKSGIAVRFPRIARWRHDKQPKDADTLESVKRLAESLN